MPSSNKTPTLQLNQWQGSDYPKKDDFNADNSKVDAAFAQHIADTTLHPSAQQTGIWNQALQLQFFSYTGDGASTRSIALPCTPRFGMVFACDRSPVVVSSTGTDANQPSFGIFSAQGANLGLTLEGQTLSVVNAPSSSPEMSQPKYNISQVNYLVLLFT